MWFQLLELTIGSSAVSIAVLLATFMGGMCIGSLGLARVVPLDRHPLRVYAIMELAIGVCGLLVLWVLPFAGGLYLAVGGPGVGGLLLRGLLSVLCLLVPTILMGASLPAVSRWVETSPEGVPWLGYLYGGNTLGAVVGCLVAGFYLLRLTDMYVATYVAVAVNVAVGVTALWMANATAYAPVEMNLKAKKRVKPAPVWPVLVTIGLSGLTALSAEVVLTRLLSLQLGPSVYTFSLILAAILLGIGFGSYLGSLFLDRTNAHPRAALGWSQLLLAAAMTWSAYLVMVFWPGRPQDAAVSGVPMVVFQHDFFVCLVTVLPAGLLWGASFAFALGAVARDGEDPGRLTGFVYAANTTGAIVGSLVTPLVLMATIGSQHILQTLIGIAAVSGGLRGSKSCRSRISICCTFIPLPPCRDVGNRIRRLVSVVTGSSARAAWERSRFRKSPSCWPGMMPRTRFFMIIPDGRRSISLMISSRFLRNVAADSFPIPSIAERWVIASSSGMLPIHRRYSRSASRNRWCQPGEGTVFPVSIAAGSIPIPQT